MGGLLPAAGAAGVSALASVAGAGSAGFASVAGAVTVGVGSVGLAASVGFSSVFFGFLKRPFSLDFRSLIAFGAVNCRVSISHYQDGGSSCHFNIKPRSTVDETVLAVTS